MTAKLYKIALAAMAAGIISGSGYAQETATSKSAEAKTKELQELKEQQKELLKKQKELAKELQEVSKKLAGGVLKDGNFSFRLDTTIFNGLKGFSFNFNNDTTWVKGFDNVHVYKMDTAWLNNLKNNKLAAGDFSKQVRIFSRDMLKMGEGLKVFEELGKDFPKRFDFEGFSVNPNFNGPNYKGIEKSKTISRSYPVDSKDKLSVNNQYGTVTVNTWNKNEIKVEVEVKAYEASEDKAQDLLDDVKIEDSKQNNLVSFKTVINQGKSGSWWIRSGNGGEQRRGVVVNYVIYMPSKSSLDVTNKFGSIILPDMDGVINVNSMNGSLKAMKLSNSGNRILVNQGSADIETFGPGNIIVNYGSLKIANAGRINAKVSGGNTRIGTLAGGNLDINMGGVRVDELSKDMQDLAITADKSSVALGIDPAANFDFDVTVNLAGFKYNNNKVSITNRDPAQKTASWSAIQNYKGQYGKGSDSKVVIKSNYGSVQFL